MSKSALASLTAQYTDSENEDDNNLDSDSQNSHESQAIIPKLRKRESISPVPPSENVSKKKKRSKKSVRRLVSYQDDTIISDEERDQESETTESSLSESEREENEIEDIGIHSSSAHNSGTKSYTSVEMDSQSSGDSGKEDGQLKNAENSKKYDQYSFSLPPEAKGKPSAELVEKVRGLYERMKANKMDMNRMIQDRKEFRNPSIYEKLIQFCDINELGTNYPPEIYDPIQWGAESYYEELARVQKNEMLKRQKERKDNDKIEQATALARKVEEEAKKRKSKWDQPATVKPVVQPTLTTTVTGTKGTVISAFGSLPKKP